MPVDHPLTSILVPIDGTPLSEQALPFALAIAGKTGSVTLLEVVPESEPLRKPFGAITMSAEEVMSMLNELASNDLDRAANHWQDLAAGTTLNRLVGHGDATEVILQSAVDHNFELIALASAGRGAIGRLALGSVTDRVVREANTPVIVVRESDAPSDRALPVVGRIIVALDGSDRALLAIPVAATLAKQLNTEVVALTAVDLPQVVSPYMGYAPAFSPKIYSDLEEESTNNARKHLDEAVNTFEEHGVNATAQLVSGYAVHAIADAATRDDIVVVTSRGQGGIKRWILGSVTERLIRECPAPVLVVPSHHHE